MKERKSHTTELYDCYIFEYMGYSDKSLKMALDLSLTIHSPKSWGIDNSGIVLYWDFNGPNQFLAPPSLEFLSLMIGDWLKSLSYEDFQLLAKSYENGCRNEDWMCDDGDEQRGFVVYNFCSQEKKSAYLRIQPAFLYFGK